MNSDFHVLNLAAYQTPEIYEDPHSDYVGYGDHNDFYTELINAFLNSPTTNSIVTGVVGQIMGKGFSALDANRKPDEFASFKNLFTTDLFSFSNIEHVTYRSLPKGFNISHDALSN